MKPKEDRFCKRCQCKTKHKHRIDPKTGWSKGWQCLSCAVTLLKPYTKSIDKWSDKFKL
jgi:hypothetical protein